MTHAGTMPREQRRLTVRLARDDRDLAAVQALRWDVFFAEMGAQAHDVLHTLDTDPYDALCDHLLVIDADEPGTHLAEGGVVGTYRLLRESVAHRAGGFYSAGEFDLSPLMAPGSRPGGELLELGRSCVRPAWRTSATISLLWRGIADYIASHGIGLMFGCASFPGTDPDAHAQALSLLAHTCLAPAERRPRLRGELGPDQAVTLERLARGSYDERRAMLRLPPLVKGYLRCGALFGDGAFIDHAFNTVDVCVVLPVEQISQRYATRFSVAA
ncbi:MAG TPA: GNAT family N-acetyltransferase [Novosphingobium capsulatum]|uniref:L-ornithine N(alpha)-acyltransferase n=2 Tax=Novosphingobium pituita TaxID=3056842 RepID=A0ABQ6PD04_9SPHN|nr:GNAT family N-acetyltransferase [Novosphingobium sp. IK01]HIQ16693.1 GNAT family N-acetyltransferase [Novosphingobium capsulatum]